jgi:hypothetical protein
MTVKELLSRMDSREISEWIAFFNLENRPREWSPPSIPPPPRRKQTVEEMKRFMLALVEETK